MKDTLCCRTGRRRRGPSAAGAGFAHPREESRPGSPRRRRHQRCPGCGRVGRHRNSWKRSPLSLRLQTPSPFVRVKTCAANEQASDFPRRRCVYTKGFLIGVRKNTLSDGKCTSIRSGFDVRLHTARPEHSMHEARLKSSDRIVVSAADCLRSSSLRQCNS